MSLIDRQFNHVFCKHSGSKRAIQRNYHWVYHSWFSPLLKAARTTSSWGSLGIRAEEAGKRLAYLLLSVAAPDPIAIESGFPVFAGVIVCPVVTRAVDASCIMGTRFTLWSRGTRVRGGLRLPAAAGG